MVATEALPCHTPASCAQMKCTTSLLHFSAMTDQWQCMTSFAFKQLYDGHMSPPVHKVGYPTLSYPLPHSASERTP